MELHKSARTYTRSGRKWCTTAQKAMPFLQEVVRLVTLTPWYSRVTSLHHSSKSCPGVVSFARSDFPSAWKGSTCVKYKARNTGWTQTKIFIKFLTLTCSKLRGCNVRRTIRESPSGTLWQRKGTSQKCMTINNIIQGWWTGVSVYSDRKCSENLVIRQIFLENREHYYLSPCGSDLWLGNKINFYLLLYCLSWTRGAKQKIVEK